MTVYVDQPLFPFRGQKYCHVWADSLEELHAAAQAAGLKRAWFQQPPKASWEHCDASPGVRARLIAAGAVETDKYGASEFVARQRGNQKMIDTIAEVRAKFGTTTPQPVAPVINLPALSILQPWAWLIIHGHKPVENRDWQSWNPGLKFRGPFLIHAGKGFDPDGIDFAIGQGVDLPRDPKAYDRGGIVGRATIVDVVTEDRSPWFFGPYGLVLAHAKPLQFQPCRGFLGFFRPTILPASPPPAPSQQSAQQPAQAALDL